MKALKDRSFDPAALLQTKDGVRQALRVGKTAVDVLIAQGLLDVVEVNASVRVTTASIFRLIEQRRRPPVAEAAQTSATP
jgi:hypothetical protein